MVATATLHSLEEPCHEEWKENWLFPDLPNDVGLQCLARVPRSCYRSLSRVCKLWKYHIRSDTLYSTRKALNTINFSLFLVVGHVPDGPLINLEDLNIKWYELFPFMSSSTGKERFKIPSSLLISAAIVSVRSKLYAIGGFGSGRTMWVYDLVCDKWELAKPQMQVGRYFTRAWVVNDKIYVMGERLDPASSTWGEVIDPETEKWSPIPSPNPYQVSNDMLGYSAVAESKIMFFNRLNNGLSELVLVFDTGLGEWSQLHTKLNMITWKYMPNPVVVSGVLYFIDWQGKKILGYDFDVDEVKEVGGILMEGVLFPEFLGVERLINMDGRLVVLWIRNHPELLDSVSKLYSTVIVVQKNKDGKLWGSVAWTGLVGYSPVGHRLRLLKCTVVGL